MRKNKYVLDPVGVFLWTVLFCIPVQAFALQNKTCIDDAFTNSFISCSHQHKETTAQQCVQNAATEPEILYECLQDKSLMSLSEKNALLTSLTQIPKGIQRGKLIESLLEAVVVDEPELRRAILDTLVTLEGLTPEVASQIPLHLQAIEKMDKLLKKRHLSVGGICPADCFFRADSNKGPLRIVCDGTHCADGEALLVEVVISKNNKWNLTKAKQVHLQ